MRKIFSTRAARSTTETSGGPGASRPGAEDLQPRRGLRTFDYFIEAIIGRSTTLRNDSGVIVQLRTTTCWPRAERDKGAIGYFGFAYFQRNTGHAEGAKWTRSTATWLY